MSWLDKLVGGGIAEPIEAFNNVIKTAFGDKGEKMSHEEVMAQIELKPASMQVELNKIEAAHRSPFVAGWRPFIGWVSGTALAFYFIPQYVMATIVWVKTIAEYRYT